MMSEQCNQPPELPAFLNRALWTEADWRRHTEAGRKYDLERQRKADGERRKLQIALTEQKRKKLERIATKEARKMLKQDRRDRKAQRQRNRDTVIRMIDLGHDTIGQMSKKSGIESSELKLAIRWLIKNERITKVTPRRYGK